DIVLVEGSNFSGEPNVFEFNVNVIIAKNLGIPVIIVASGENKTKEALTGSLQMVYQAFVNKDVRVLALVTNKIQPENLEIAVNAMKTFLPGDVSIFAIPLLNTLSNPTLKEIMKVLG